MKHGQGQVELYPLVKVKTNRQGQSQRIKVNRSIKMNFLCFFNGDPLRLSLKPSADRFSKNRKLYGCECSNRWCAGAGRC